MEYVTFSGNLYGNSVVTGNSKSAFPAIDDHDNCCIKSAFGTAMFCPFSLNFAMIRYSNLFLHLTLQELSKSLGCNKNFGHKDGTYIRR